MNKKSILSFIVFILFCGFCIFYISLHPKDEKLEYLNETEKALEEATPIKHTDIEKLANKQVINKDYRLKTVIKEFKENPAYITHINSSRGSLLTIISNPYEINQAIIDYKNKKYNENEHITLVWKTDKNYLVTANLATDIKEEVNVVGLEISDLLVIDEHVIKEIEDIKISDITFDEIVESKLKLSEIEKRTGELYTTYTRYPLLEKSNFISANSFEPEENANDLISEKIIRNKYSYITITAINNDIISIKKDFYDYNDLLELYDLPKVDDETFNKIKSNNKMTEKEFLELIKTPKLIEIRYNKDDKLDIYRTKYLIINNKVGYLITFEEDVIFSIDNYFEIINSL